RCSIERLFECVPAGYDKNHPQPGVSFEQMFELCLGSSYGPRRSQEPEAPMTPSKPAPSTRVRKAAPKQASSGPGRPKVTEMPDTVTGLTRRQQAILDVIRDSVERRGYPPSIREICESAG